MTAPQKEFLVERILRENGFEAFCPVEWRWRRVRHRSKKREQFARPKLRPYVFLTLEGPAVALDGVLLNRARVRYLGENGLPTALPESAIGILAKLHEEPRKVKARNTHMTFRKDEVVKITEGPFEGETVSIKDIKGKHAVILRRMFGAEREMLISFDELEAA